MGFCLWVLATVGSSSLVFWLFGTGLIRKHNRFLELKNSCPPPSSYIPQADSTTLSPHSRTWSWDLYNVNAQELANSRWCQTGVGRGGDSAFSSLRPPHVGHTSTPDSERSQIVISRGTSSSEWPMSGPPSKPPQQRRAAEGGIVSERDVEVGHCARAAVSLIDSTLKEQETSRAISSADDLSVLQTLSLAI